MLIGQYEVKITDKGRLAIPSKFRQELGKKLIIAKWYEECLVIVSEVQWEVLLDKLTGKSETVTQPIRDTDRFILGSAFEIDLDSQGRFVIPIVLKNYAKLKSKVVFVGLGKRIELWDTSNWRIREKYIQENASDMVEKLSEKRINN